MTPSPQTRCVFRQDFSLGTLAAETDGAHLTRLFLPCEIPATALPCTADTPHAALARRAFEQIEEYLAGTRRRFDLPLKLPSLSPFAARTMAAMAAIPYGETRTYAQLGAARAAGRVCSQNPLPLIYPCHRVLPAAGGIGNYRGGVALKAALLNLERE